MGEGGGEQEEGREEKEKKEEDCDGGRRTSGMGRKQRAEENTRERARARNGEQKVCEACSRISPRLASPSPCYRRGEDEKSVELTFIGKLQAAAFGTE